MFRVTGIMVSIVFEFFQTSMDIRDLSTEMERDIYFINQLQCKNIIY